MKTVGPWIAGVVTAFCIVALIAYGRSERRAYWAAHRAMMVRQTQAAPPAMHPEWPRWHQR